MALSPRVAEKGNCMTVLICMSYTAISMCTYGLQFSFGVIYSELLGEFREGYSKTAWIGSLPTSLSCILAPVCITLARRYGVVKMMCIGAACIVLSLLVSSVVSSIDQMIVSYGVVFGFGSSAVMSVAQVILPKLVTRRLGTVYGIGSCGGSLGPVVLTPILNYMMKNYSWRVAFRILGGGFAVVLLFSLASFAAVRKDLQHNNNDGERKRVSLKDFTILLSHGPYVVFTISMALACLEYVVSYTHQVQFAIEMGVQKEKAAMIPTFMAISNALGRFFSGLAMDLRKLDMLYTFQAYLLAAGAVCFMGILATTYTHFMVYFISLLFFEGGFCAQTFYALSRIVPADIFTEATSVLLCAEGFFIGLGPPLVGVIVDKTDDYSFLFFVTGSPLLIAGFCMFLCRCTKPTMEYLKEGNSSQLEEDSKKDTLVNFDDLDDKKCLTYRVSAL